MKKIIALLVVIFFTATAFVKPADNEKNILGKWRIADDYIQNFITSQIENARKTEPERAEQMEQNRDAMEQLFSLLVFEYKANNVATLISPQGSQDVKWRLSEDKNTLIITRPNGTERKDSILELTPTKFKVLQSERRDTIVYVRP